ncbi:hypothetical protein K227x_58540 [Rubripirellula lacrimiformis]|uniref:Type II secretion system protein GspC N-terminal domain-containing protein n=1 Tax=Rubripirellula lacrimiformis TaxID=1930273 RepID=A0A517NJW6_9BACT|nr:hypothetical protein K227x_58540 [Rubripirellula lacrimiformis]
MPDQQKRLLLWLASGLFCAAGVATFATSQLTEIEPDDVNLDLSSVTIRQPSEPSPIKIRLGEKNFRYVWGKPLRRQLSDPIPTEPPPAPIAAPPAPIVRVRLDARLIATLVDADPAYSAAWISCKDKMQKVTIGDSIKNHSGSPIVTAIKDRLVEIELTGESHLLHLDENILLASRSNSGSSEVKHGN